MTKTLADMTPEERAECCGMWVDFLAGKAEKGVKEQGVFAYWQWVTEEAIITIPRLADTRKWAKPENVTPRFDLPRAWNPDGTPPRGKWEEGGYFDFTPGASPLPIQGRRWVGEWEEA